MCVLSTFYFGRIASSVLCGSGPSVHKVLLRKKTVLMLLTHLRNYLNARQLSQRSCRKDKANCSSSSRWRQGRHYVTPHDVADSKGCSERRCRIGRLDRPYIHSSNFNRNSAMLTDVIRFFFSPSRQTVVSVIKISLCRLNLEAFNSFVNCLTFRGYTD